MLEPYNFLGSNADLKQVKDMLQLMPDPHLLVNTKGNIIFSTDELAELFHYSPDELIDQPLNILIPNRFHSAHNNHLSNYAQHPTRKTMAKRMNEVVGMRKDGSEFFVDITLNHLEVGSEKYVLAALRDISFQQREKRRFVQREENLLRKLDEANLQLIRKTDLINSAEQITKIGYWELNVKHDQLMWSPEVYRIFGQSSDFEPSYERFLKLVHPEDRELVNMAYSDSIRNNLETYEIEHRIILPDTSETRYILEKCQHIRNEKREIVKSSGTVMDVTSIREKEVMLHQISSALDSSEDGIFLIEEKSLKFTYSNLGAVRLLGYTREEFRELQPHDIESDTNEVSVRNRILPLIQNNQSFIRFETQLNHKSGYRIPVEITVQKYITPQKGTSLIAVVRNLTELNRKQEEISNLNKLLQLKIDSQTDNIQSLLEGLQVKNTQLTQANEELHLKAHLLENIKQAVITTDPLFNVTYMNHAAEQLFNCKLLEVIGQPMISISKPQVSQSVMEELFVTLKSGKSWTGELVLERGDGTTFYSYNVDSPYYNEKGELIGFVGIKDDITERKRAEAELIKKREESLKNEVQFKMLLHSIPDPVIGINRSGEFIFFNQAMERVFGYSGEKLAEMNLTAILDNKRNLVRILRKIHQNAQKNKIFRETTQAVDSKGTQVEIDLSATIIPYQDDTIILASLKDITREKQIEQQLNQRDKILAAVAGSAFHVLSNLDWLSNLTPMLEMIGKASQASRAYVFQNKLIEGNLYTSYLFEWCDNLIEEQLHNPDLQAIPLMESPYAIWTEKMKKGEPVIGITAELEGITREILEMQDIKSFIFLPVFVSNQWWGFIGLDHCEIEKTWSESEIDALSAAASLVGIGIERLRINTELTEQQTKLEGYTRELEISNAELEQFAYIASHDLQEPLRMVRGFLELLEKKYENHLDEKARNYIHFAVDGAERMRKIISDLLEYSRVGRNNPYQVYTSNLCEIISEVQILLRNQIDENNAEIICKGQLPKLKINPLEMQQVFQNILSNALKYRKKDCSPKITVSAQDMEDEWVFCVEDNGIGIPQNQFERVFQIFQRLHLSNEIPGTGMGLAIVKKIVENNGGSVWVESVENEGSAFFFSLPKSLEV
jgi:PAS domain S-box-containing protein